MNYIDLKNLLDKGDVYDGLTLDLISQDIEKKICLGYQKDTLYQNRNMLYNFSTSTVLRILIDNTYLDELLEKYIVNALTLSYRYLVESGTKDAKCLGVFNDYQINGIKKTKEDINLLVIKNSLISDNNKTPNMYLNLLTKREAFDYIVSNIAEKRIGDVIASARSMYNTLFLQAMNKKWVSEPTSVNFFFTKTNRYLYLYKATGDTNKKTNMWYYYGKADRENKDACFRLYLKYCLAQIVGIKYKQINRKDIKGKWYLILKT